MAAILLEEEGPGYDPSFAMQIAVPATGYKYDMFIHSPDSGAQM
jgi:hypothetical protein